MNDDGTVYEVTQINCISKQSCKMFTACWQAKSFIIFALATLQAILLKFCQFCKAILPKFATCCQFCKQLFLQDRENLAKFCTVPTLQEHVFARCLVTLHEIANKSLQLQTCLPRILLANTQCLIFTFKKKTKKKKCLVLQIC